MGWLLRKGALLRALPNLPGPLRKFPGVAA